MGEIVVKALIVSRHKSTVEFLSKLLGRHSIEFDVRDHVSVEDLKGYPLVLGNIPVSMIVESEVPFYIQVNLEIPRELRGKELSHEELSRHCKFVVFEHLITFDDWAPRDKAVAVAEYDIWIVKDIHTALEEVKRILELKR